MYRILVASPKGPYGDAVIDPSADTSDYFTSEHASCFISLDPSDVERCDGVVVPGGVPDVSPARYGEENCGSAPVDLEMDQQQFDMIDRAVQLGKPLLGICRGMQLCNVYFGGSLIQDIGCKEDHRYDPGNVRFHELYNVPSTFMYQLYGARMKGNSLHHQAVKRLPDCLAVSQIWCRDSGKLEHYLELARSGELHQGSDECVLEAVYHKDYPFVGIQWHPEMVGPYYCRHVDLTKIPGYFYQIIQAHREM